MEASEVYDVCIKGGGVSSAGLKRILLRNPIKGACRLVCLFGFKAFMLVIVYGGKLSSKCLEILTLHLSGRANKVNIKKIYGFRVDRSTAYKILNRRI
jgi:hypothetical protein